MGSAVLAVLVSLHTVGVGVDDLGQTKNMGKTLHLGRIRRMKDMKEVV